MKKCHIKVATGVLILLLANTLMFCCPSMADVLEFNDGSSSLILGEADKNAFSKDFRFVHLIKGSKFIGHNFTEEQITHLEKEGIKVGENTENNYLKLEVGNILFSPDKNIIVGTNQANLYLSAGAVVFIIESNEGLVIYDLRQNLPKQVSIVVNKKQLYIEPGHMVVLSKNDSNDFEKLDLDCHAVLYGRTQKLPSLAEKLTMFTAEFSVSAAFLTIEPLRQLVASSNKQDKLLFEKILRGAATLHDFLGPIQPSQLANTIKQL